MARKITITNLTAEYDLVDTCGESKLIENLKLTICRKEQIRSRKISIRFYRNKGNSKRLSNPKRISWAKRDRSNRSVFAYQSLSF